MRRVILRVGIFFAFFASVAVEGTEVGLAQDDDTSGKAGISVVVAKGKTDDPSGLTRYANMDFVLQGGQSADRALRISGSLTDDCRITLQILDAELINDEMRPVSKVSPLIEYAKFSDNNFMLAAGEVKVVYLTVDTPANIQDSIKYGFVSAECRVENQEQGDSDSAEEINAEVNYIASYLEWIRVITGDPDFVAINFELVDVGSFKFGAQKYLRLFVDNESVFAIQPNISVELVSQDFSDFRFGPLEFSPPPIAASESSSVDLPIPAEVTDGNWRIFVRAVEGNYTKQREFQKFLSFESETYEQPINLPWYEIILGVLSLIIVILLIALMRRKGNGKPARASTGARITRRERKAQESQAFLESLSEPPPANPDWPDQPPRPN